jgi:hypothetical protein
LERATTGSVRKFKLVRRAADGGVLPSWTQWQREVVGLLRHELEESLRHISLDDVDWPSWSNFYLEGRSPRAAIDRALERDL